MQSCLFVLKQCVLHMSMQCSKSMHHIRPIPSFLPSFVRSLVRSLVRSFVRSIIPSFVRSFVCCFLVSFNHLFIRSFMHSFHFISFRFISFHFMSSPFVSFRSPNKPSKSKFLKIYLYNCVDRFSKNLSTEFAYIVRLFSWKSTILILYIFCIFGDRKSIDFWPPRVNYLVYFVENS